MPRGLRIPIGASSSGGIALVKGDANNAKIINLALSDTENENAYQQDIGLGHDIIFDLSDSTLEGILEGRLELLFEKFEKQKRFKLLTDTIKWERNERDQELLIEFRYMDLESDEEQTFARNFRYGD